MNLKTTLSVLCAALALAALPQSFVTRAAHAKPHPPPQRQRQINVYFYTEEHAEYIDLGPVRRMVRASSPARAALEALLAGPTPAEERKGYSGLIGAGVFRLAKLKIAKGTARVEFVSNGQWAGWSGDLAPAKFEKAVELTLKQFPNVRRVIVSVDGEAGLSSGE